MLFEKLMACSVLGVIIWHLEHGFHFDRSRSTAAFFLRSLGVCQHSFAKI